ncbi:hypothetical protein ACIPY6_03125 [Streptomyces sp. NPDC090054]|uniref:hypothetical protein n=1 Tax=Streptomyces sp. NPDC090054 TaxID=3365933 RepID=UPI003816B845
MTGRPCDVPGDQHDGNARLYPCGWRCTSHAPQARTTSPAPDAQPVAKPVPASRKTRARQAFTASGLLVIDMGQQLKNGTWFRKPTARYECWTCNYTSDIVTGAHAVLQFIGAARSDHYDSHHRTRGEAA